MSRIDNLNSPLNTATELERYCNQVRVLCRDFYMELTFAADVLQQNLATLPVAGGSSGIAGSVSSRVRARQVARCLRRAADAQKYSGSQAVKCWRMFVKVFAPEIDAARKKSKGPKFKVDE